MAKLIVQTPEGVEIRQDLAGAGSRTAAAVVDGLICSVGMLALGLVIAFAARLGGGALERFLLGLYVGGITLIAIAYPFLWHVYREGQTPGKRLVGIRVVAADGAPATTVQHLLRSLILIVDILPVPVPLGILLAAVTPRHTRLGDLAAGTLVLRVASVEPVVEPWPTELWTTSADKRLGLEARAAHALDPRDLAYLRDVVTRRDLEPSARARLFQRVAAVYCARLGVAAPANSADVAPAVRELFVFARELVDVRGSAPSTSV
jgi:uncharacterized RDD family membrane protein YckC